ncbi:chromate resistance protein ChrB domain-containing protein [Crenobacter cavernae]|uniref:Chromate resistance protein n=1 Tax=Crenobacter cavernae TaxID=2290923 RepID=A0ABY0FDN2_9NEIS|nr:chromate resistance protein ChrB domain-containing protein [Crenobacter cavernae]RXZ44295.1 chromate resistance protein [Crenobacter cavernae]
MKNWMLFVTTLPTENATARMRAWRALKASGAAVLRDGVYLLPETEPCRGALEAIRGDVEASGGTAYLLRVEDDAKYGFTALFDRTAEFAALFADIEAAHAALTSDSAADTLKQARKLRKAFSQLTEIDFFPCEAQRQTGAALLELEVDANRALSPDEPRPVATAIPLLDAADFRGRLWATRRRPWVDRLASAWLIRRFVDADARFLWLTSPTDCPPDALGFDFDGARFTHVGAKVTFETLIASFGLDRRGLKRLAALVHYLDAGGVPPPEASGVERVLAGLREAIADDDALLTAAGGVFDGLFTAFDKDSHE